MDLLSWHGVCSPNNQHLAIKLRQQPEGREGKMEYHKLTEDRQGDKEKYGYDVIEIHDNSFEFMAHCELWNPKIQELIKGDDRNTKYKVIKRSGKTGYYTKKFIMPLWTI